MMVLSHQVGGDSLCNIEYKFVVLAGGLPLLRHKMRLGEGCNHFSLTFFSATQLNSCTCLIHIILISGKARRPCALAPSLKVVYPRCDGIWVVKHFSCFPGKVAWVDLIRTHKAKRMRSFY